MTEINMAETKLGEKGRMIITVDYLAMTDIMGVCRYTAEWQEGYDLWWSPNPAPGPPKPVWAVWKDKKTGNTYLGLYLGSQSLPVPESWEMIGLR